MAKPHDEVMELIASGSDGWNAWARQMIDAQSKLREDKLWSVRKTAGQTEPLNEETRLWFDQATVALSDSSSLLNTKLSEFIFPGPLSLSNCDLQNVNLSLANFHGRVSFNNCRFDNTSFQAATFWQTTNFDDCIFLGDTDFTSTSFRGQLWCQSAGFFQSVSFWCAEFFDDVFFNGSTFHGPINFDDASFREFCSFVGVTFSDRARFLHATLGQTKFDQALFKKDVLLRHVRAKGLSCERSRFEGYVDLRGAHFDREFSFRGAICDAEIDLAEAKFGSPPDFTLTSFRREPLLDRIHIKRSLFGFYTRLPNGLDLTEAAPPRFGFWIDKQAPAKFRELKRLATALNDQIRALDFHAKEIRASRFVTDWPIPWMGKSLGGVGRFWMALLFDLTSDFGRSILRPLIAWIALGLLAACLYLSCHPDVTQLRVKVLDNSPTLTFTTVPGVLEAWKRPPPCVHETPLSQTDPVQEALHLAAINAVLFADSSIDGSRRTMGCLYGLESPSLPNSPVVVPSAVNWVARVQRGLSVILIFLFGLGLRNMLKL